MMGASAGKVIRWLTQCEPQLVRHSEAWPSVGWKQTRNRAIKSCMCVVQFRVWSSVGAWKPRRRWASPLNEKHC